MALFAEQGSETRRQLRKRKMRARSYCNGARKSHACFKVLLRATTLWFRLAGVARAPWGNLPKMLTLVAAIRRSTEMTGDSDAVSICELFPNSEVFGTLRETWLASC
jgi:hypothetical protein